MLQLALFKQECQFVIVLLFADRDLESASALLSPLIPNLSLGNTHLVGQDPNYDKTSLYPDMLISYRWLDNMQEYSLFAFQALQSNFTKRNSITKSRQALMRNRNPNNHNTILSDYFIGSIQRSFDMQIELVRPFGIFFVFKIVLDRTLRAIIVLRGHIIEWVLVKGFEESFEAVNGFSNPEKRYPPPYNMGNMIDLNNNLKLDIWTLSRYQIFRIITEHANAAILHFYAPFQMESAIKAYLVRSILLSFGKSSFYFIDFYIELGQKLLESLLCQVSQMRYSFA